MLAFYLSMLETQEEKDKFQIIYKSYGHIVYGIAISILRNKQDAQDAMQESFLKIIKNLDKINLKSCKETPPLIVIITRGISIDINRKKGRSVVIADYDEEQLASIATPKAENPIEAFTQEYDSARLKKTVAELSNTYSKVLLLKYEEGRTNEEIAKILNIKISTVWQRLSRAKALLKQKLFEAKEEDEARL